LHNYPAEKVAQTTISVAKLIAKTSFQRFSGANLSARPLIFAQEATK
jgi:hypothetical protein